jgi:hypothetical protein
MAKLCGEIRATVTNKVGRLAEVTDKVKDAGVNILALCAWVEGDMGHLLMVTADNDKVYKAITPAVETCEFGQVVCVKAANTPGTLNEIAHKLAGAGVGIDLVYAAAGDAGEATIVLRTTDNDKAAKII